jgi:hypothetical protein
LNKLHLCLLLTLIVILAACESGPVVVVATPVPPDGNFRTYRHPSGVFSLRLPPDWSVRDVTQGGMVRVEFSPPNNSGLPLTVLVVNTGRVLTASDLLDSINQYQGTINGNPDIYHELARNAQGDGSWRLVGVRQTPIGPRELNTFLQVDRVYLSAVEVDVTDLDDNAIQQRRLVLNTFRVNAAVEITTSQLQPPAEAGVPVSSGVLQFTGLYEWINPQGAYIINGQVTNVSGGPLEAIRVVAILFDAQGNTLVEQPNIIPLDVLDNNEAASFSIRFNSGKPSQAVRYELEAAARNADYAIAGHLSTDNFVRGNEKATYNAAGLLVVSGDVVNATQNPAYFIKVFVTIVDEQQRVVASENVFLTKPDLLPGEAAHFEVTFFELGGSAARYLISVEGKSNKDG